MVLRGSCYADQTGNCKYDHSQHVVEEARKKCLTDWKVNKDKTAVFSNINLLTSTLGMNDINEICIFP